MGDRKTYAGNGSSEVLCGTHGSGLNKRQCSVQLKIFADGAKVWESKVRSKGLTCESSVSRKGLVSRANNVRLDFSTME